MVALGLNCLQISAGLSTKAVVLKATEGSEDDRNFTACMESSHSRLTHWSTNNTLDYPQTDVPSLTFLLNGRVIDRISTQMEKASF